MRLFVLQINTSITGNNDQNHIIQKEIKIPDFLKLKDAMNVYFPKVNPAMCMISVRENVHLPKT